MMTVGDIFDRTAERYPERTALVDADHDVRHTYAEWDAEISSLAASLAAAGIGRGDRVATIMRNRAILATLFWATQRLGAVFVPLHYDSAPDELHHSLETATPDLLFFSADTADTVERVARTLDGPIEYVDVDGESTTGRSYRAFREREARIDDRPEVDETDDSVILFTAGTTGKPKGVPRSHLNGYAAATAHAIQTGWEDGVATCGVGSMSHTMSVHSHLAVILLGGKWVCLGAFDPEQAIRLVREEALTSLYLTPTHFHDIFESQAFDPEALSTIESFLYAGSKMRKSVQKRFRTAFPDCSLVNVYGSTEIYSHSNFDRVLEKPNCAGRAGINTRVRVVDIESDEVDPEAVVEPGELGEILVDGTSPEAFDHYLSDEDESVFVDGWFPTGDLGYRDREGDLFIVGRVDNMIISGGTNINPHEVETVLEKHDEVLESAVIGLESDRWNQVVAAYVYPRSIPDYFDVDFEMLAAELDRHCRESDELATFKCPKKYIFVEEIVKSNVGKILRRALQHSDPEELDITVFDVVEVDRSPSAPGSTTSRS